MANRSGSGTGIYVFIAILLLTTVGFFVTTVLAVARANQNAQLAASADEARNQALGPAGTDANWETQRQRAGNTGVVPYLSEENADLISIIGGSRSRDTAETLRASVDESFGASGASLTSLLTTRTAELNNVRLEKQAAENARNAAIADRDALVDQLAAATQKFEETRDEAESRIAELTLQIEEYRSQVNNTRTDIEQTLMVREEAYEETVAELNDELQALSDENAQLAEQVRRLRGETRDDRLSPQDEATLVDGLVVGIDPGAREVYINRGRADRVVLGMTFEVYGRGVSIRADEQGNISNGKATIEVIRIEDGRSVARIIDANRGDPILQGDRIVNAVWDANKEYRFVVFGNFDTNFDGSSTPGEADAIRAIITEWGGVVEDELTGRTDFVVLGTRPLLPPAPRADDPFPIVERYLKLREQVDLYNAFFEDAGERSIPVLNQNRLLTLTGLDDRVD